MIYLELFWGFLKIGAFAFGGAYGAIPLIRDEVLSRGWVSEEIMTDMIAVSESTPGPIMVNLATYVGSTTAGLAGAAVATAAVVLPSFFVILLLSVILKGFTKNRYVQAVLRGVKPCMIGLILATGAFMVFRNCFAGTPSFQAGPDGKRLLFTAILLAIFYGGPYLLKRKISPILLIVISAALGTAVFA